jgi:phosphomannomutase
MSEKTDNIEITDLMTHSGVTFGTSGARGLADAMTDRVCYAYTVGFLQYLERAGAIRPGDQVVLAGDYRPSTPRIMAAAATACEHLGYLPINAGRIPTPALAAFAMGAGLASLMVTGSHIPDDRNGIKFYKPDGEILKSDESEICAQRVAVPTTLFDDEGHFAETPVLPPEDSTALRRYIARYLDFFPAACLSGCRVLVYEHSSVAAAPMTEVFSGLGADVIRRGYSDAFVPVDTEAIRPEDVELAADWARDERFDLIVSADGDGDRPLVGDEHGRWLRGDVAGVLTAHFLDAEVVVTPVSSNTVVEKSQWFNRVLRTRIGSPYVIAAMQQAASEGAGTVVGYEANGGFLQQTRIVANDGRELAALPTRDAVIVAVCILLFARRRGVPVSQLPELLPSRFTASDRLKAFPTSISAARIAQLAAEPDTIAAAFPGLGEIAGLDQTDGLRLTFGNEEVVHLRPSGNAPELRCYTEADSEARARALNAECLRRLETWRA